MVDRTLEERYITPSTSIFELGIDSISVLRLAREMKKEGLQVHPALILRNPLIGQLVDALEAQYVSQSFSSTLEARLLVDACQHRSRGRCARHSGLPLTKSNT